MHKIRFEELTLSNEVNKAIKDMGFEEATPIQSLAIPKILTGKDIIGQAQTGTGKTAAFGIPILETIDPKVKTPQAIVLCPTRELAIQVAEEVKLMAKYKHGLSIVPVYGGQPIDRQIMALRKGCQLVIGTPGRVMDHLDRRTLKLDAVKMVVLDEADEMLDMGFRDDIELILKSVPAEHQTVLFSATFPKQIMDLARRFQKNPETLRVAHDKLSVPKIEQYYFEVKEDMKLEILSRVIDVNDIHLALVFCNTKRKVDELVTHLQARGYAADGIHGDLMQSQRDRVMAKFRKGTTEILVATDVAARGIDVDDIDAVFNYDIPVDEESYVHRIGRTGRAGRSGKAFSFVSGRDVYKLREIQRYAKIEVKRKHPPSLEDVAQQKATQFFEDVSKELESGGYEKYVAMIERFIGEHHSSLDVAAVLLKLLLKPATSSPRADKAFGNAGVQEFGDTGAEPGYVRLFINVGRMQKVGPGDIVGAIAGETGISGKLIGHIEIHDKFTFVEVPEDDAAKIIEIMKNRQIKGNRLSVKAANQSTTR